MDGISAGRALRAASVNDLIMVPQKYGTNSSIAGKNLSGVRDHTVAAFCRRRCTSSADRIAAHTARTMGQTQRRTAKCPLRTYRRHVKNFFTKWQTTTHFSHLRLRRRLFFYSETSLHEIKNNQALISHVFKIIDRRNSHIFKNNSACSPKSCRPLCVMV